MSELKSNKISPAVGTGVTLGDDGDTFTIPAGVTLAGSGASLTNLPAHTGNIAFPATQSASGDANTLDDYEEGSWTPQLTDGTNTNTTNRSNNLGEYVKIGKVVFISCTVATSAIGSLSGQIWCDGLPFTVSNANPNLGFAVVGGSGGGMGLSAGYNITGNFNANTTKIAIYTWDVSTSTSGMQASEWGAGNTQMTFAGHYWI